MIHFQNCPKSFQNCPKSLKNAGDFFVAIWNMERNHWQAAYQSQWLHMINYACCLLKRGTWNSFQNCLSRTSMMIIAKYTKALKLEELYSTLVLKRLKAFIQPFSLSIKPLLLYFSLSNRNLGPLLAV